MPQQPTTPGWYPDPWAPGHQRWFDGSAWTTHAFRDQPGDAPAPGTPPAAVAPGAATPPPPEWAAPATTVPPPTWSPTATAPPAKAVAPARLARGHAALIVIAAFVVALVGTLVVTTRSSHRAAAPTPRTTTPPPTASPTPRAPVAPPRSPVAPPGSAAPGGTAPGGSTAPGGTASPTAAALPDLVLQASDVGGDLHVAAIPGGDSTSAGATLDLCNGSFPSESLRVARLQDAAADRSGTALVSTEAVAYASSAATSQALHELATVAAACPSTPVTSPVGEATVTTVLGAAPDGGWPQVAGVDRLAFSITTTDSTGTTTHSIAVYLRRGPLLVGVYLPQTATPTPAVDGQTTPAGIAGVFAGRLAALPAATVAG